MKLIFYRLILFLDTANEDSTYYNIAWYMAHNFSKVSSMGINQFANECFVSPATVSRFCRALGYENFAHLKQECRYFDSNERRFNNLINIPFKQMANNPQEASRVHCQRVSKSINDLPDILNWDNVDRLIRYIHDFDNVAFFGTQFSQSVAIHLQTDLLMLEKFTVVYLDIEKQLDCAHSLDENSVAIIMSVNGRFVNSVPKIVSALKKTGCKIVLITKSSRVKIDADVVIKIGEHEDPKIGKQTLLAFAEILALRYYAKYYPEVEKKVVSEKNDERD